jgi:hypothetical protein
LIVLPVVIFQLSFHNQPCTALMREVDMRFSHLLVLLLAFSGISAAQEVNFSVGPEYLSLTGTEMLRPIATPTLNLDAPLPTLPSLPEVGPEVTSQPYLSNPVLEGQPDLFPIYYGYPPIPIVELVSTESTPELPPSITGVLAQITDAQSLRERGYGVTVGEAAAYWRAHKSTATRVYTNADIPGCGACEVASLREAARPGRDLHSW